MARKQKSRGLNRFLDMIGLVDSEHEEDVEQEPVARPRRNSTTRRSVEDEFDGFDERPQSRVRPSSSAGARTNTRINLDNNEDEFGEDQGWSTARPNYAASAAPRRTSASSATASARPQAAPYQRSSAAGYGGTTRNAGYRSSSSTASSAYYSRSAAPHRTESQPRYNSRTPASEGYVPSSSARWGNESHAAQDEARASYQRHQTVIFTLHSVDECKDVILALIDKKSVLLNLDKLDTVQAQRALDTMCGATYAIGATLSRASDRTWLIAPSNVEVEQSRMEEKSY